MKHKKLITTAALALAAISFVSTSVSAANVTTAANDLILGFQVIGGAGQGANTNLEVDLGPASNYTSGATFNLTQLAGADLTAVYGSGWATRTDLSWSIAGSLTSNSYDATSNGAHIPKDGVSQAPTVTKINGIETLLSNTASTTNSAFAGTIGDNTTHASAIGGSFTFVITNNGGTGADYTIPGGNQGDTQRGFFGETPIGNLELYKYIVGSSSTNATDLGKFTLSSGGNLTFTGIAAVPEPSTWALALCGLLLVLVIRRRNFSV